MFRTQAGLDTGVSLLPNRSLSCRSSMFMHPAERRELHVLHTPPQIAAMDQLRLVQAVDRLGQGIVIGIADAADRGCTIYCSSSARGMPNSPRRCFRRRVRAAPSSSRSAGQSRRPLTRSWRRESPSGRGAAARARGLAAAGGLIARG
jgi:hypothetical protein